MLGLKERSDRRDVMVVQSSLSGFNVEWVDGVKGEDIPDKALPPVSYCPTSSSNLILTSAGYGEGGNTKPLHRIMARTHERCSAVSALR